MDWGSIAKKVIGLGAPIIGRALGGPLGGMAGDVLAKVLGVEPTPDAVSDRLSKMTPEQIAAVDAAASEKWNAVARMFEAEAEAAARVGEANAREVNETIRQTAQGDGLLGKWRGVHAWELTLECFLGFILLWICIIFWPETFKIILEANAMISMYFSARFGVLGVHTYVGSKERQASLTQIASRLS
jgi:hypothetical protein